MDNIERSEQDEAAEVPRYVFDLAIGERDLARARITELQGELKSVRQQHAGAVDLLDEFDRYASGDNSTYAGSPFEAKVRAFLDSHQLGGQ